MNVINKEQGWRHNDNKTEFEVCNYGKIVFHLRNRTKSQLLFKLLLIMLKSHVIKSIIIAERFKRFIPICVLCT